MKGPVCIACAGLKLVAARLHFACVECGEPMLLVDDSIVAPNIYHCPNHCTTLIPNRAQRAAAQAARN